MVQITSSHIFLMNFKAIYKPLKQISTVNQYCVISTYYVNGVAVTDSLAIIEMLHYARYVPHVLLMDPVIL